MMIIGVGHAGCRTFASFEEVQNCSFLREFTSVVVGEEIDVLPVDTDFLAYARSREQARLDELDRLADPSNPYYDDDLDDGQVDLDEMRRLDGVYGKLGSIH